MDVQYKQYPGKNKSLLEYEIMLSNIDDDSIWNSDGSYLIQSIASSSSSSSSAFTKHIHLKKLSGSFCDTGPKPPSSSSSSSSSTSSGNTKMDTNIFRAKHFHRYSEKKKNNFYTDNLIVFLVLAALLLFHQFDSCDCLLPSPPRYEHKTLKQQHQMSDDDNGGGGANQVRMTISNTGLANIRLVRSYSEEFMSSSEERERGLQFFGGSSAGSSSSSSSTMNKRISPYFETESLSTNVTISEGSAFVHLPCRVKQLGDRTLSWIRRQDVQILTVGTFTYISDQRFQAIHRENSDDWSLQISYPRKKDAGIYECQVSTMPKMSLFIQLNVIVSRAKILEGPVLYLSSGSTLNLTCVVKDTPEPPDYIFWYHNGQVINYGSPRDVKVYTEKSAQTISSKLIILKAQANDSGNYSCTPSNAEPAHIAVHIQNNANPAASIQHGKRSASREYGSNKSMRMSCTIGPLQMAVTTTMITIMLSIALYL